MTRSSILKLTPKTVVCQRRRTKTLSVLVLIYLTFLIAFIAWLLSGYYQGLPGELAESAMIDGAGFFRTMRLVDLSLIVTA